MKRVLIIDGMNNFTRSYVVDPTLDTNGNPIGGLSGFLKILQKNIREVRPDKVIVCWEGPSGSLKRRSINKNYKAGRKAPRLNRQYDLTPKEEKENKIQQHVRLLDYLELFPVTQLVIDNVEADDLIAWAARAKYFNGWQKVILSNDKDFYQLCDDDTIIVRPVTKEIMNKSRILSDFNIHPDNFGLARAIVGDSSDNIAGVAGVGLPTVAKRLPFLKEDKSFDVSDVIKYCKENVGGVKAYSSIAENEKVISENYELMQLYIPSISAQGISKLHWAVENTGKTMNKTKFRAMLMKDGLGGLNLNEMLVYLSNQGTEQQ